MRDLIVELPPHRASLWLLVIAPLLEWQNKCGVICLVVVTPRNYLRTDSSNDTYPYAADPRTR
jgi:hypothetical protein